MAQSTTDAETSSRRQRLSPPPSISLTPSAKRRRPNGPSYSLTQPSSATRITPASTSSSSSRLSRHSSDSATQPLPVPTKLSSPSLLAFRRPFSITRVTMTNFMCYSQQTVTLGPHLNLIVGPNGAGNNTPHTPLPSLPLSPSLPTPPLTSSSLAPSPPLPSTGYPQARVPWSTPSAWRWVVV